MTKLPDPRRYGTSGIKHRFARLAESACSGDSSAADTLRLELREVLAGNRDEEIFTALKAAPSRVVYAELWRAVCNAAHGSGSSGDPALIVARIFALPLVIISGCSRPAALPGTLPDVASLTELLAQHGALGMTRNFGFGNALVSFETLDHVRPSAVHAWTTEFAKGGASRELEPCPIVLARPGEEVHLRFLVGAGITPAGEPSLIETASNIGKWGMAATKALAAQLSQPGVEVLPIPRPPLPLLKAGYAGRFAQLDTAFGLFASNALRRFRTTAGDPVVTIAAHDDAEIRVGMSSPFDTALREGFRWPLHPLDQIAHITESMAALLAECRVTDVHYAAALLPALNASGQAWFATPRDVETISSTTQH